MTRWVLAFIIKPRIALKRSKLTHKESKYSRTKEKEEATRRPTKMALQWMILTYLVAAEAVLAFLLTIPSPKLLKKRLVSLVSLVLQPSLFIVPFAGFQLLGNFFVSWENVLRLCLASVKIWEIWWIRFFAFCIKLVKGIIGLGVLSCFSQLQISIGRTSIDWCAHLRSVRLLREIATKNQWVHSSNYHALWSLMLMISI